MLSSSPDLLRNDFYWSDSHSLDRSGKPKYNQLKLFQRQQTPNKENLTLK